MVWMNDIKLKEIGFLLQMSEQRPKDDWGDRSAHEDLGIYILQ